MVDTDLDASICILFFCKLLSFIFYAHIQYRANCLIFNWDERCGYRRITAVKTTDTQQSILDKPTKFMIVASSEKKVKGIDQSDAAIVLLFSVSFISFASRSGS
jgi:hypothetical protein